MMTMIINTLLRYSDPASGAVQLMGEGCCRLGSFRDLMQSHSADARELSSAGAAAGGFGGGVKVRARRPLDADADAAVDVM